MAETKITQLEIAPSIDGTEYLIVDNTEVTRRTTINSLSSVAVKWSTPTSTVVQSNSASWNNTTSVVQSNSASWVGGISDSVVQSNSANWNNTTSVVQANSASWVGDTSQVQNISSNHVLNISNNNNQLIYSSTTPITAFITDDINVANYSTTLSQIGFGSISVKLSSTYLSGATINTNNLDYTPTRGSSINIKRIADNQFLVSPVFFYLVP